MAPDPLTPPLAPDLVRTARDDHGQRAADHTSHGDPLIGTAELAALLGVAHGTMRTRLFRARHGEVATHPLPLPALRTPNQGTLWRLSTVRAWATAAGLTLDTYELLRCAADADNLLHPLIAEQLLALTPGTLREVSPGPYSLTPEHLLDWITVMRGAPPRATGDLRGRHWERARKVMERTTRGDG